MFLLFYLIIFLLSNRINATNISTAHIPKIERMYPLPTNDQIKIIAAQFNQNPNWEEGNMPMSLTEQEETTPKEPESNDFQTRPGVIIKSGHQFYPEDTNPYRIDRDGVHYYTEHHIFLVRHGLYLYTEDDSTSHLFRYGKYQARMAGHKINKKIREIIEQAGPLTRPIKLVSSTQTRAFETLYNIRLQLSNNLQFEPEIIQDTGLTECTNSQKQRIRWLYFVREYLQPIKSRKRENTITIIASHGNLLTTFDYIIRQFIGTNQRPEIFRESRLPSGNVLAHGEILLYRTIGTAPIFVKNDILMNEIPITVNHAELRKDFYYEWAALHQCRSDHGREEMRNYIRAAVLDNVFTTGDLANSIRDYETIVYLEMEQEYDAHILPMLMHACRTYLYRLPLVQANTNFGNFSRLTPPIPVPETEAEQSSPLNITLYPFSGYSMPFPVDNTIQKFRKNPFISREEIPHGTVHPQSRDARTSYLTRLGINQIRGVMSHVHAAIHEHRQKASRGTRMSPINIIAEPTIESAETCFHVRSLLLQIDYPIADQITDLGLENNYYQKRTTNDYIQYQRVQILYILRHYLTPDQNNATHPTIRVHILCGDGRLFTAFRREIAMSNLLVQPYTRFPMFNDPHYNALKHGNAFYFEAIGEDMLKLHDVFTLANSRGIKDDQKISTEDSLQLPTKEFKYWLQSESGPCTLSYFIENKELLSVAVVNWASFFQQAIARELRKEWSNYLAGLFIYACRLQLTLAGVGNTNEQQELAIVGTEVGTECKEEAAASKGPSGDCA